MKTAKVTISKQRLKEIIAEEVSRFRIQNEAVDHEGVKVVVNSASKLLKAATDFKENANATMTNAVTPGLDSMINTLEEMISNPSSYTDKKHIEPKRIKLRQVKEENQLMTKLASLSDDELDTLTDEISDDESEDGEKTQSLQPKNPLL